MQYLNLSRDNVVVRSNQLLKMKDNLHSLGSLKILDVYLSRINPLDPENKTVEFKKKEYEKLIGISKINTTDLLKYTDQLQKNTVVLPIEGGGYDSIVLFERCRVFTNEQGETVVQLTCSETAKKIFFNIEGVRYIKYQLSNIINLKSTYSLFLYYYLLENEFRKKWTVSLDTLKQALQINNKLDTYNSYKFLNVKVLKPSVNEINKKTNISVKYASVCEGRAVTGIEFSISQIKQIKLHSESESTKEADAEDICKEVDSISEAVAAAFEKHCPTLKKPVLTDRLKQSIIREYKDGTDFEALFITVSKSDFLSGKNGKWLGCELAWCLENKEKILSGRYSNGTSQKAAASQKAQKDRASYDISELEKIK